jgi:pimeloyl-ACP methyl ester carboxylesterase
MPYVNSGAVRIYYESHGQGPVVMFVHGSGGHHAAWWQQVPYFARQYRVLTIDLRGFGNSDPVEGGPDAQDFPEDLLAVLDDAGVDRVVIVGQSIGAVAALQAGVRHPQRVAGVVLAHSLGGMNHPDITPLVKADRAVAEKLPVIDRLLTSDFQTPAWTTWRPAGSRWAFWPVSWMRSSARPPCARRTSCCPARCSPWCPARHTPCTGKRPRSTTPRSLAFCSRCCPAPETPIERGCASARPRASSAFIL